MYYLAAESDREQCHDRGVTCPDPGIAVFARAFVGIGETFGRRDR